MSELPIPKHFDKEKASLLWQIDYGKIEQLAKEWAREHKISPSAEDVKRVCLFLIDCQNSFCLPKGELFVMGAPADSVRICQFIYKNLNFITDIVVSLDTHSLMQIFHPIFWTDGAGNPPPPGTIISPKDIKQGAWTVNKLVAESLDLDYDVLREYALYYVETLKKKGKYLLIIWPVHAQLGSLGHCLVSSIGEAVFFHNIARFNQARLITKGGNPLSESYSVLSPEVLTDHKKRLIGKRDTELVERLLKYDEVIICGQAKSHCVAWTIDDLLLDIYMKDPKLTEKISLFEDCTSPVVIPDGPDFTEQANEMFGKFGEAGMNITKSIDWKGI